MGKHNQGSEVRPTGILRQWDKFWQDFAKFLRIVKGGVLVMSRLIGVKVKSRHISSKERTKARHYI